MKSLLVIFCLVTVALFGKIVETPHFCEIERYLEKRTLIILDIDDTLLIPVQTLGTDVWFMDRLTMHKCQDPATALDKTLAEWEALRHLTQVKIVEEGTEAIVDSLQKRNIPVMGLTTQGLALATRTQVQLRSLKIDLSKTAPTKEDHYFINQHGVLYRDGILFTSGTPKGSALLKFLSLAKIQPSHILFINDKLSHLQDVEASLLEANIPFTGLRYSFSDTRVKNYRPELAEYQRTHSTFDLLSDQEAEAGLACELKAG